MSKLKFCGLYREEDIQAVNQLEPDYIGFILANKGHRKIDHKKAARLKSLLKPSIQAVGVFINEDIETIRELVDQEIIDLVQLHGSEDNTYIRKLRSQIKDIPIIKAFAIRQKEDIQKALESDADFILLDSKDSGSGQSFSWKWIEKINRPYFLAGGIDENNILEALKLQPYALDLSSGIETDKLKDFEKMKRIYGLVKENSHE